MVPFLPSAASLATNQVILRSKTSCQTTCGAIPPRSGTDLAEAKIQLFGRQTSLGSLPTRNFPGNAIYTLPCRGRAPEHLHGLGRSRVLTQRRTHRGWLFRCGLGLRGAPAPAVSVQYVVEEVECRDKHNKHYPTGIKYRKRSVHLEPLSNRNRTRAKLCVYLLGQGKPECRRARLMI